MTLDLHATAGEVMRAVDALREFGHEHGVPERALFDISLALEESGSNIVNHALRRDPRQTFQIIFQHTANSFVIELRDHGPAFDPTTVAERKLRADEDDAPGRWGIQLVRRYMDDVRYTREGQENVLRLTKRLGSPASEKPFH